MQMLVADGDISADSNMPKPQPNDNIRRDMAHK